MLASFIVSKAVVDIIAKFHQNAMAQYKRFYLCDPCLVEHILVQTPYPREVGQHELDSMG